MNRRVASLVGDARPRARVRAQGRIVRAGAVYRLTLTVHDEGAAKERTIDSASCKDLAGAAAVSLGLLVRGESRAAPANAEPGTVAEQASSRMGATSADAAGQGERVANRDVAEGSEPRDSAGTSASPALPEERPRQARDVPREEPASSANASGSRRSWGVLLRAPLVSVELGPLPDPAVALGVGAGARFDEWRWVLTGRIFLDQMLTLPGSPGVGADVSRATLELSACRGWRSGRLELSPCLLATSSYLAARGVGAGVDAASAETVGLALGGALLSHLYLTDWVAFVLGLEAGVELSRPRLLIRGLGEVGQLGLGAFSASLGSEWIF